MKIPEKAIIRLEYRDEMREYIFPLDELNKIIKEKQEKIDKAMFNIQRIIDYGFDYDGFDYDGFESPERLKGLIDMIVDYAKETKDILKGSDSNE